MRTGKLMPLQVESELQRHVDERSENCRLKEELAEKAAQIAELTEERSSFKASVESERRVCAAHRVHSSKGTQVALALDRVCAHHPPAAQSLVAQVQEKELEIERLHNQLWGKEEAIRERCALHHET